MMAGGVAAGVGDSLVVVVAASPYHYSTIREPNIIKFFTRTHMMVRSTQQEEAVASASVANLLG